MEMEKLKKVVLLKGQSSYNVLRYWTDSLAKGLEKIDVETIVLDLLHLTNEQIVMTLQMVQTDDVDAIISFNGYLFESKEIVDKVIKIPYIYLLVDHPIDHLVRIQNLRKNDILTLMDRNDVNNLARFGYEIENTYMLPHAAIELSIEKVEKDIDILISSTYSSGQVYLDVLNNLPPLINQVCMKIIENCLNDSSKYYIEEFIEVFKNHGIFIDLSLEEYSFFTVIARQIGRYLYSVRRLNVITALAEAGLTLDVYGNGWEDSSIVRYENVKIHKPVNYWKTQDLMRHSKIIMSFQALLRDGTHERVFAGMAARSVVVTNETLYLRELFEEDKELIFYNFDKLDDMVYKVKEILKNNEKREKISDAAWNAIKGKHTFEERAKTIVEIFKDTQKFKENL